jgi:hypothetical protein
MIMRPRYVVTLEFKRLPSDPAGIRRLRGVLKRLLRSFGARCLDCRPAPRCVDLRMAAPEVAPPESESDCFAAASSAASNPQRNRTPILKGTK